MIGGYKMYFAPYLHEYLYAHRDSDETDFVFPITGLDISNELKVGKCIFLPKKDFRTEEFPVLKKNPFWFEQYFKNVQTIALVNTANLNQDWYKDSDHCSIALQLLKQSIGAIYMAFYSKTRADNEKRIVISDLGSHEVDEGLNPCFTRESLIRDNQAATTLIMRDYDISMASDNLSSISQKMDQWYNGSYELHLKVLKCLELLYCLLNEIYSNERILKICAFLNFLFNEDEDYDIHSPTIIGRTMQLFNKFDVRIYDKLPSEFIKGVTLPKKPNDKLQEIYNDIRNRFSHGKIDVYSEFTIIHTTDYLLYKIVFLEFLYLLMFNSKLNVLKSSKELNAFVDSINEEYKAKRLKNNK